MPLFIINEGEDRGKGQWGERKRAAGTHAQLRKKEKKKAGSAAGATCLRVRIGGERRGREGGEKGEEIQRERKLEYRRQRQQHQRGPEQQKKRQAGRSLRQRTRGLEQRHRWRQMRQQRVGRAEQWQAGTRGCSRGARRSSFAGVPLSEIWGLQRRRLQRRQRLGSGTHRRAQRLLSRTEDKQGGGGCSSGVRNSFAGGSVVFPSSWAAVTDSRHRRY